VYQFHRPDPSVPFGESIGALLELQREGKVRHIGLSNVTVQQLREAQRLTPIASVQNRYNLSDRGSDPVLEVCENEQGAFLPWAPIQDHESLAVAREIASRYGSTVHQVVLAWLLARSPVMVPIPGTGSVTHLEENVAAAGLQLSADEVQSMTKRA
jgi:pyridoxine 4-dehydrogenase